MNPNALRRVTAVLDVIPFSLAFGTLDWLRCIRCSGPLNLIQPDSNSPERLLGVCEICDRWALIELRTGEPGAVMVLLPEPGWIQTLPPAQEIATTPARSDASGQ